MNLRKRPLQEMSFIQILVHRFSLFVLEKQYNIKCAMTFCTGHIFFHFIKYNQRELCIKCTVVCFYLENKQKCHFDQGAPSRNYQKHMLYEFMRCPNISLKAKFYLNFALIVKCLESIVSYCKFAYCNHISLLWASHHTTFAFCPLHCILLILSKCETQGGS